MISATSRGFLTEYVHRMQKHCREKNYIRDGRSPIPADTIVSYKMSRVMSKNTRPELTVRKELCRQGLRGYRLHRADLPGRPDIVFMSKHLALFINGCFWHRCPYCSPSFPRSNVDFWSEKFRKNKERDLNKVKQLDASGWIVVTLWECQVKYKLSECITKIRNALSTKD